MPHAPDSGIADWRLTEMDLAAVATAEVEAIRQDLESLVACDTSFPPGAGYARFCDVIERILTPLGYSCRRVVVPESLWRSIGTAGDRVNLIAIAPKHRDLPVCSLYFHTDTVPAGDGWTRPPFHLTTDREGRLYGRGTADMKGSIAAAIGAIRAALKHGMEFAYAPALLFCTDEEGGLYPGIRYLAEQGLVEGHVLSFNGGAAPRIWAGCFGSFDLMVRISGRTAHSGDPGDGINAVEESLPVLNALQALKLRVEQHVSTIPSPPHYQGEKLRSRLTIAAAHGGERGSALPGLFSILVNRRYAPEESFESARAELEETIDSAMRGTRALRVETELLGHLAPVANPTGPHWRRWQAALSAGFGYAATDFREWGSSTSSDMGWVQRAGIQEILLGGLSRPDNHVHAADEYTTLGDLRSLTHSVLAYLSAGFAPNLRSEKGPGDVE